MIHLYGNKIQPQIVESLHIRGREGGWGSPTPKRSHLKIGSSFRSFKETFNSINQTNENFLMKSLDKHWNSFEVVVENFWNR